MNTDPLSQLRDIHLPAEPGWWPPAFGWWILLALALLILAAIVITVIRGARRRRWRREAMDALATAGAGLTDADSAPASLAALSQLLRRCALAVDEPAAGLAGAAWSAYLAERAPLDTETDVWRLLGEAPYRKAPRVDDPQAVLTSCRRWIEACLR